jgi:galactoside O-acetyltransferase
MGNAREYLHTGELYYPGDPELLKEQNGYQDMVYEYNNLRPTEGEKRTELLKKMLAECGEDTYIEAPFHANFGGHHCHLGKKIYINFNLTCVDDTHIYIGDYTMIGPNVTLATAGHPIDPELRKKGLQFNKPIHIGKNCWLGSGVLVMPGVTIGDNTVIGAGSVVTKDIPSNVVAFGNPCRVYREVGENKYGKKDDI